MVDYSSLTDSLKTIKTEYENAVIEGGTPHLHALIRSQGPINHLHEHIKHRFVELGVDPAKISPKLRHSSPELTMVGFLKKKSQDICILTKQPDYANPEKVDVGVNIGQNDPIGLGVMNQSISINVRSQLSSLSKNFDTLFERTFAEPLNLHLRASKLIMGEVYMIPIFAYDDRLAKIKQVGWREKLPAHLYIPSFRMLNGRDGRPDPHAYERVALLIADFRQKTPKVFESAEELVSEGIIAENQVEHYNLDGMTMKNFAEDVLQVYKKRHGSMEKLKNNSGLQ